MRKGTHGSFVRRAMSAASMASVLVSCDDAIPISRICTTIALPSLSVTVVDSATGQRVCDATVVARDGSFQETLTTFGPVCTYSGPHERRGVYEVRVTRQGYVPASVAGVEVTADECHVITREVTVTLVRAPAP